MKKIILPLIIALVALAACKNKKSKVAISTIDRSITAANAYNSFFLDSSKLEAFLGAENLQPEIADKVRSFYYSRNFEFAWLTETGLTEQARGFWNLHSYYSNYNKADSALTDNKVLNKIMSRLNETEEASLNATDSSTYKTELTLTEHFIIYLEKNFEACVLKYNSLENFVPKKKQATQEWAKAIIATKEDDFEKENHAYKAVKDRLKQYNDIAVKGGWPTISYIGKTIKKGETIAQVSAIKKRLQLTGELTGKDTTALFDDAFEQGVKNFQTSYGFTADGKLGDSLIKLMNIPVTQKMQQLIINLNRMRWLPTDKEGRLIVANIPEYKLHIYENDKEVLNMKIVVGKEGHNTVIFSGKLSEIVFSPYWNIPTSIAKKEIEPAVKNNPNYLAKHNMELVDGSYRQKPGGSNSLGKVKFLFPNAFNIYFHDTPAKSLFENDVRAYSHGCIRISEPQKMAEYLLLNQAGWDSKKIVEAMNAGTEKSVAVAKPVSVIITYYTAWIGENNQLNFRDDIYNHDADMAKRMFTDAL